METDQSKTNRREFNRIAAPLYGNLYGAAMRLTRNPAEAEDLTQDTMVRAWRFWSTFQQGTNIKAWMFTILRNTFINGYHREGRRSAGQSDVADHIQALGDDVALGRSGRSDCDAEAAVDAETMADAIRRALSEVAAASPDYALAVELADLEGWSYKEIAEAWQCPVGTVMSRIYRGRKALREMLVDHARALGITVPVEAVREPVRSDTPLQLGLEFAA